MKSITKGELRFFLHYTSSLLVELQIIHYGSIYNILYKPRWTKRTVLYIKQSDSLFTHSYFFIVALDMAGGKNGEYVFHTEREQDTKEYEVQYVGWGRVGLDAGNLVRAQEG